MDLIKPHVFTEKQLRFIQEYPCDSNASAAARRAGYSAESAAEIGYELKQNPAIWAAIEERARVLAMSADEAIKHTSDIAATRLNDFMVVRQVQGYQMEEQLVTVLITHARNEIKQLEAFIGRNRLTKEHRAPFDEKITALFEKIAEYEILVERYDDDVTLLVPGRPVVHEVADLDLVALAKAKETGRIKSLKHTKEGVQVEMLDAQAALRDVLKLHGKFVKKVETKDTSDPLAKLTDDQLLDEIRKLTSNG